MSHYEERLGQDLTEIRNDLGRIAADIERALENATHALLRLDRELAAHTILGDLPINRAVREVDRKCHAFVARHLPSAGHLRFISSVLQLCVGLERVGDYAVTVSREAVQLAAEPPPTVARDIELISDQARRMLRQSMRAFLDGNADMARGTIGMAAQFRSTFAKVFEDLTAEGETGSRSVKDLFGLLVVLNRLERVSDQAKNVCEETVFAATGRTKEPKVYRILFLDERNDRLGQLAVAMARRAYPESGAYCSAGWQPAPTLAGDLHAFIAERGLDLGDASPTRLVPDRADLDDLHVIVSLRPDAREHIGELPFHTVLLHWPLDPDMPLDAAHKELAVRIRGLMETLRGPGAS